MDIQAVGTAFNVKSYDAEPKVQLTEGKIKVRKNGQEIEISAGNEVLSKHGELETSKLDNPEEATAWKDGFFSFDGKGVAQILDELTRWYGIDVVYNGTLSQKRYEGGINKNSTLAQVCSALNDLTDYNFKIEGNKLLIENKK
jgi:ferric-dicitrate binding protein FerR (iron transport regulator)